MKEYYVTFRSITFAQRGQSVLNSMGIPCFLQRTPRWMEEKGCGYCLRLKPGYAREAVDLLRSKSVPFSKLYARRNDDGMEELQP